MTQPAGNIPPVLHPSVLETLLWELDEDEGVWAIFIRNYINLLPDRIERVRITLTTGDLTGATDAVLSLKTSSEMVGAARLAHHAELLQDALPLASGPTDPVTALPRLAAEHYQPLKTCSLHTVHLLKHYLDRNGRHGKRKDAL